jgi:hypothetical protein
MTPGNHRGDSQVWLSPDDPDAFVKVNEELEKETN